MRPIAEVLALAKARRGGDFAIAEQGGAGDDDFGRGPDATVSRGALDLKDIEWAMDMMPPSRVQARVFGGVLKRLGGAANITKAMKMAGYNDEQSAHAMKWVSKLASSKGKSKR